MTSNPPRAPEARFDLCINGGSFRFKQAEATLVLSDEGVSYTLDGRSGLRPYARLKRIRLQAVHGGRNSPWEALVQLEFASGRPLNVFSTGPFGADDPVRDKAFIGFVEELHRRLSAEDRTRIEFLRGIPPGSHRVLVGVMIFFFVFGVAGLFILTKTMSRDIPVVAVLGPMAALAGIGIWVASSVNRNKPGRYDPERLPRELYPSA